MQESQCDPAGREKLVRFVIFRFRRSGVGGNLVRRAIIAEIEEAARNEAALLPPIVRVHEQLRIARSFGQRARGGMRIVLAAIILRAREDIALVLAESSGHGIEQCTRVRCAACRGDTRLSERRDIGARKTRRAHGGIEFFLPEHTIGPEFVILAA